MFQNDLGRERTPLRSYWVRKAATSVAHSDPDPAIFSRILSVALKSAPHPTFSEGTV
jgi:hypothetical protein